MGEMQRNAKSWVGFPCLRSAIGPVSYTFRFGFISEADIILGRTQNHEETPSMKFQRIEFSWRAAFIGFYMTPERDKVWVTVLPFFPLYFKRG